MAEAKDPAIKLFGKTIQLPDTASDDGDGGADCGVSSSANGAVEERESNEEDKDVSEGKPVDKEAVGSHLTMSAETKDPSMNSMLNDSLETPSAENESATAKTSKTSKMVVEEQSDTTDSLEKTFKKPDKILPCPRCNSMETKFCYFNNYNVSQPRHFCKNCQRYWTAGGTMRNVPVGAGRRKNKAAAAQCRQTTATEALPSGLEPPDSATKTAEKLVGPNGFPKPEFFSNGDCNPHGFSPQVPWFPGSPWAYPWNPQTGSPLGTPGFPIPMPRTAYPWNPQTGPPGFPIPMPFYPAAPYWACGPWHLPWIAPNATPHPGPDPTNPSKHSREENTEKDSEPEKRLWIPKTLRIDDPNEAAKSSIWSTLGIKNDRLDSGGFFKTLESKGEEKTAPMEETTCVLQANPAALSRSLRFQEGS